MEDFKIDPEFEILVPPLSDEEYLHLESDIAARGCLDPLIVWVEENILIDGHHRRRACLETGSTWDIKYASFPTRDDVKIWIIRHQFGRRNLLPAVRAELALKLKDIFAAKAKANQSKAGGDKALLPNLAEALEPIDTREEIAQAAGLSHGTIAKAEAVLKSGDIETIEAMRRGGVSIHRASEKVKQLRAESVSQPAARQASPEFDAGKAWEQILRKISPLIQSWPNSRLDDLRIRLTKLAGEI